MGEAGDADRDRLEAPIGALGLGPAAPTHRRQRWLVTIVTQNGKPAEVPVREIAGELASAAEP